jgi:3-(3-hydroxy-phenyl)propionate hydroxylase
LEEEESRRKLTFGACIRARPFSLLTMNTNSYQLPEFAFTPPPELHNMAGAQRNAKPRARYPVIVVGGGLAGLTMACDLANRGIDVVLLDEDNTVGVRGASSRGICYAQKTLEIFARLGIYDRIAAKGIRWSVGKTLAGNDVVYSFDLAAQMTHSASQQPPFINLQQFYIEWFLVDRLAQLPCADVRWKTQVVRVIQDEECVTLDVTCPAGDYQLKADWVIDATGIRSPIRDGFGLQINAAVGEDRWCISDVRFKHKPPIERWTWVEAAFNDNRAVWQHLMADDVWRLDYQMAPDSDPNYVSRPDVVTERLQRQFGPDIEFELVWVGPYSYRSHVLEKMRLGRVFFLGDSAHVMSPFGARGGNSAIQDADNLGWKLAMVLQRLAPESLLDSYHPERHFAAEQNVEITNRTMRFLTPQTPVQRLFRDATIALAKRFEFAQKLVNTGRLSSPTEYVHSPLHFGEGAGNSIANCALTVGGQASNLVEFVRQLGNRLVVLCSTKSDLAAAKQWLNDEHANAISLCCLTSDSSQDTTGYLTNRFGLTAGKVGLLRPDLHSAGTVLINQLPAVVAAWSMPSALSKS